jgi:hypothetical protein
MGYQFGVRDVSPAVHYLDREVNIVAIACVGMD